MGRIWVKIKGNLKVQKYINEENFDPNTMEKFTDEETKKNIEQMKENNMALYSSNRPPLIFSNTTKVESGDSMFYNGKLDEGATRDFIDRGLMSAKTRAVARNKKFGSSFRKVKNRNLRRKK